jgi:hypothetical protein
MALWIDDMHFVQLCNSYELPIDTLVKTYDVDFQSHENMDYIVYEHSVLWMQWICTSFVMLSYIVCKWDVLHDLMESHDDDDGNNEFHNGEHVWQTWEVRETEVTSFKYLWS